MGRAGPALSRSSRPPRYMRYPRAIRMHLYTGPHRRPTSGFALGARSAQVQGTIWPVPPSAFTAPDRRESGDGEPADFECDRFSRERRRSFSPG
jgi:hypothetical protein